MIQEGMKLSISRQCELLSVARRSYYYKGKGEGRLNKEIQKLIGEQYQRDPTYGSRRITAYLRRIGYKVNRKRIQRLMKKIGIKAIYPKPKTSVQPKKKISTDNIIRNLHIRKPNQLWYTDITYIKLSKGYCYAVVVLDAYSKKLLSIRHSNTLDRAFCIEAAKEAYYNQERLHQALNYKTPDELYYGLQAPTMDHKIFVQNLGSISPP